ncbi:MAG: M20/M25/M40 family metallo-hydrolase [Chloroflexi bacterium]|nr:M20/M25/M40 family metallo-hydrolase [Chloroflexota bacterium]
MPPTFEEACKRVDERRDDLIALVRQAVAVNTVVPPGLNYEVLIDLMEPRYRAMGFSIQRVTVPQEKLAIIPWPIQGPRVNLVATRQWPGNRDWVTTYAHMDVVPIEEAWQHDPFAGEIVAERIYGRGVADMKGSMCALVIALEIMHELGLTCHWDMVSTLCTDEEIGIYPGIGYLAEEGYVKGHVLTLESASQDPVETMGGNGMIDFIVTTRGRSSHSGRNHKGVNAVEAMVPVMEELLKLKEIAERRESRFPTADPDAPSKFMTPKFNLDMIQGGNKSNIVPATCSLVVNRRFIPDENAEDVINEFQAAVERGRVRSKALSVDVQVVFAYPAVTYDMESPYMLKKREAMRAVKGYTEFQRNFGGGSNDMSFVQRALNTDQFVGFSPSRMAESNAHGADESVRVADLVDEVKELVHYLAY